MCGTMRPNESKENYHSMKIAVCDDEQAQRTLLEKYIAEWGQTAGVHVHIESFSGSEQFLFRWEDDQSFDLLVLDVEMGQMSGVELAKKLRREQASMQILFVTGFEQYMAQGYEVEALHYLLKPVQKEKLFAVLDKAMEKKPPEKKHIFHTKEGTMISLPLSEVWYVEAEAHDCRLYTSEHSYVLPQGIGSMRQEFEKESDFQTCHRSYIVNMKHVSVIEQSELIMDNGVRLPVSRGMAKAVNQAFIRCYM